ncbi:MAG: phosphoribosylanthranilate isomerase [Planctomycetes bacterium]|nr:phosphoribosylanthranilate isomerase [Planctomycetota bacterium]
MAVKVKICGITNVEDALAAIEMGADLLGFNFYPQSKRYVTGEQARQIINKLPTFVDTAGIFVNAAGEHVREVAKLCFLNWVQIHGDETPEYCDALRWISSKVMKAIRIKDAADIEKANTFYTDAVLLDAFHPEEYGGTGQKFDWNLIRRLQTRVFLAGGITPENAVEAVEVGAYGIDICSGIESSPGKKDHEKMQKLFDNIKHVRG